MTEFSPPHFCSGCAPNYCVVHCAASACEVYNKTRHLAHPGVLTFLQAYNRPQRLGSQTELIISQSSASNFSALTNQRPGLPELLLAPAPHSSDCCLLPPSKNRQHCPAQPACGQPELTWSQQRQ